MTNAVRVALYKGLGIKPRYFAVLRPRGWRAEVLTERPSGVASKEFGSLQEAVAFCRPVKQLEPCDVRRA